MEKNTPENTGDNISDNDPNTQKPPQDLGFGTSIRKTTRYINRDGSFNVKRTGLGWFRSFDFYHKLITMSWAKFFGLILLGYLSVNLIFSSLYMMVGVEHLAGTLGDTTWTKFLDCFFFSAQTITTLGYGRISPVGASASTIAAIESMLGLLAFAMATGLLYGRFSHPNARIKFTEKAIIAPYKDITGFEFRIANERSSQLIEVEVQVVLSYCSLDSAKRKFAQLKLERDRVNFLALSWTIVHPITEDSPLYGWNKAQMEESDAEFIILVKGFDDTFSQTIYARSSYKYFEVEFDQKFSPIFQWEAEGMIELDLRKMDETTPTA